MDVDKENYLSPADFVKRTFELAIIFNLIINSFFPYFYILHIFYLYAVILINRAYHSIMVTNASPTATMGSSTFHAFKLPQLILQDELPPYNCIISMPYRILAYWLLYYLKLHHLVYPVLYSQNH